MKKKSESFPQSDRGFTLIELMVVIAIIVVLATIVLAYLHGATNQANDKKVLSQLDSMKTQSNLFSATLEPSPIIEGPYVASTITGQAPGGTVGSGTLFNDNTLADNGLYQLASNLPKGTVIYYAWDGKYPLNGGKWFFAASISTGAFCVDWSGATKSGTMTSGPAVSLANFTALFPNAAASYLCN